MKHLSLLVALLPAIAVATPDVRGRLMTPERVNIDAGLPVAIRVSVDETPQVCDLPLRVLLSEDELVGDDLVLADIVLAGCLQDGQSRMTYRPFKTAELGAILPGDVRHVIVRLDPDGVVEESDETNNDIVSPPIVLDDRPDLELRDLAPGLPSSCVFGEPFQATFRVLNTGVVPADPFDVGVVLQGEDGEVVLGQSRLEGLDLGLSAEVDISGTVPPAGVLAAGAYRIAAVADTGAEIEEMDEGNNALDGAAVVCQPPAADFAAVSLEVPPIAAAAEQLWVHRRVENRGILGGEAALRYLLTADDVLGPEDVELPVVDGGPITLASGEADEATDVLLVPTSVPAGTYRVAIQLDPEERLAELDEDNNVLVSSTMEMREAAFRVVTRTLPDGLVGYPYLWQLVATGGGGVHLWSAEPPLPPGLLLEPGGMLRGTPAEEGSYTLHVTVRSGTATSAADIPFEVVMASGRLLVSTSLLPSGHVGQAYHAPLAATGGEPPYSWSIAGGLPGGMALEGDALTGVPQATGCTEIGLLVSDATGAQSLRALPLCVVGDTDVAFLTIAVKDGIAGEPYQQVLQAAGGAPPYTFQVVGLEGSGLSATDDGAAVLLAGVPRAPGRIEIEVSATDSVGMSVRRPYVIVVRSRQILLGARPLPVAVRGAEYPAARLEADRPGVLFHLQSGTLPEGLALREDGLLAGTVAADAAVGTRAFLVRASDGAKSEGFRAYSIDVRAPGTAGRGTAGCCAGGGAAAQAIPAGLLLFVRRRRARG